MIQLEIDIEDCVGSYVITVGSRVGNINLVENVQYIIIDGYVQQCSRKERIHFSLLFQVGVGGMF